MISTKPSCLRIQNKLTRAGSPVWWGGVLKHTTHSKRRELVHIRINIVYLPPTPTRATAFAYPAFQTGHGKLKHGYFRKDQKSGHHDAKSIVLADVPLTEDERVALQSFLHLIGKDGFSNARNALNSALATAFKAGIEYTKKAPPT